MNKITSNGYTFIVRQVVGQQLFCEFKVLPKDFIQYPIIIGAVFDEQWQVIACDMTMRNRPSKFIKGECILN